MANQQGALTALPDPEAACHPATEDSVDIEFEILDVESEILDVATALAERARMTSLREYLLPPERLAALSPANRLKLLQKHLSRMQNRLTQDPALAPRQNEADRFGGADTVSGSVRGRRPGSGAQTRVASKPASQPATVGENNASVSTSVPVVIHGGENVAST